MVPIDSLWTSEKINELLPAMPGNLPDVQDLFYRIQKGPYTWFALVDLSDMFFALPLHPKSREMTTFTWNNKQYQFKRLPHHSTCDITMVTRQIENPG
jgi:hypothetical protein